MSKLILTVIVLIFGISLTTIGQGKSEDRHPIDIKLLQCFDTDSNFMTTTGRIHCYEIAKEDWEKELNIHYDILLNVLAEGAKIKLKKSQIKWFEFRDLEYEFSNEMYLDIRNRSTMSKEFNAITKYEIVKARALELKSHYDSFTFEWIIE